MNTTNKNKPQCTLSTDVNYQNAKWFTTLTETCNETVQYAGWRIWQNEMQLTTS